MACRCQERREMIAKAARGQVPVSQAAKYVARTAKEDTAARVARMLKRRSAA